MTTLGVFRDDYYNPQAILPTGKFTSTTQASGTLAASALTGATENYVATSGATALTTDTAANIIANIVASIQANAKGAYPAPSVVGFTSFVSVRNTNAGTLTLSAGTGVTITGTATLATGVQRNYLLTVTSGTAVTLQDLGGSTVT